MKTEYLYRFRSTHALLNGYHELESQQIYFCPPQDLNDPLEGFKDIFWRGDRVVWRNMVRHYLLNLMQATSIAMIEDLEFKSSHYLNLVHQVEIDLPASPIKDIYKLICEEFFSQAAVNKFVEYLARQSRGVRRDELRYYFRLIHPLAMNVVRMAFEKHDPQLLQQSANDLDDVVFPMLQQLEKIFDLDSFDHEVTEDLSTISGFILSQLDLIHEFNNPIEKKNQPWAFVKRDFPNYYVSSLERLIYPDWHVACFVASPTNPSMWGGYADAHQGVCLKFKASLDGNGFPALDLYRVNGGSWTQHGVAENYAYVSHRFEKVSYTSAFPQVDFFESIGALPRYKLENWFLDQNGERSGTASRMLREDESWRSEYWQKFTESFTTKSTEWKHEEEFRLILHSSLHRFDELDSRKLKYRFQDLAGIVFGIKTSSEDKLKIMKIIEQKCLSENRLDFEFHQAYYSNKTKKIELMRLSLLKVKGRQ